MAMQLAYRSILHGVAHVTVFGMKQLDDTEVAYVAEAIEASTTLVSLELGYNSLTSASVLVLAKAVERSRTLERLNIDRVPGAIFTALCRADVNRRMIAFLAAGADGPRTPAARFVNADGDRAIAFRVMQYMVASIPPPPPPPPRRHRS